MNIKKFVIFNSPRVGSNMLCTMLDNHSDILCHHEIFNPHVVGVARSLQNDSGFHLASLEEREADPEMVLARLWEQNLGNSIVGFKLCWRQHDIYRQICADISIQKIILKRKNRLRSYISLLMARKTTEWVVYHDGVLKQSKPKINVDINDLKSVLKFNDDYYNELESIMKLSGQTWLETNYEQLFTKEGRLDILNYLGVNNPNPAVMQPGTIKLNNEALQDLIDNYDDLEIALQNSELQSDLYER